ncbi:MAG: flagellar basal-body MS-ring/collar protein FliF [Oscillospiraceae bacterium]|nr:flagellar basal-body MS-ring/collar protein FliF [Oscillospiraceae bacterium]MDY2862626.1 flagellar basal-body MS-ring/collar protein FliF [Oscillospiraceae bacterium]
MNEKIQKTITTVKEYWGRQTKKTKGIYIGGLALVLIIAIVAVVLLNKKDYVVLYEGLDTSEAAEIVQLIEESGYECTLRSGGTIVVPKGTEDKIAMNLAMQKYPKSSINYDTYTTNVGMFTTESEKRQYERIAAEERLSAILSSFEGVRDAVATLTIPEKKNTVIEAYKQEPSANAVIYLEDDVKLSNEQIEGMTYLITTYGIKKENITLVDNYGALLLAEDTPADVVAEETRKLKFKNDLEDQIREKIEALLIPAYGEDGFSAAVNMVLNFDSKVSEDTVYTPSTNDERGMLQHTDASQASGYATADGGVQGVETNADDTYPEGTTNGNGQWTENSVSNTYLVNTYKEQVEKAGYVIDGLSISVVIYTDYLPDTTRQNLVNLVANAGTVNPAVAQDVVTVTNLQKTPDTVDASAQTFIFGLTLSQLVILGAILLGILLILIIILVSLRTSTKRKRREFEKTILAQHAPAEGEPLIDSFFSLSDEGSPSVDIPSLNADTGVETKETIIRRELTDFARTSPEIVAQLLRSWVHEEEENAGKSKKKKEEPAPQPEEEKK